MDGMLAVFLTVAIALLVLCILVAWGLVRATRSAQSHARRAKARVAEALPASTFGKRLWWLNCRVTRVEELADQAVLVSSSSPLAEEVASLAGDLRSECRHARLRIRGAARLTSRFRRDAVGGIDMFVHRLETGAESLVELAEKALSSKPRDIGTADGTERVIRRTESYKRAIDELTGHPLDDVRLRDGVDESMALEPPRTDGGWVPPPRQRSVDSDDADAGARLVAGVQSDEERSQRLDR
jgi:hypothetical protein